MGSKSVLENSVQQLSEATGWPEDTARKILEITLRASRKAVEEAAAYQEQEQKRLRTKAARLLLKNYHKVKSGVESSKEHTLYVLKETEFEQYFSPEESQRNQRVRSLARKTITSEILWNRLNAALRNFKSECKHSGNPRIQRQYGLLYDRYLCAEKKPIVQLCAAHFIEQTTFYKDLQEAVEAEQKQITNTDFKRAVNIYWALTVARSWENIHKSMGGVHNE